MNANYRTAWLLLIVAVALGLNVLAQRSGNSALAAVVAVLSSASTLVCLYAAMKSHGRSEPGSPWFQRGRRFQWIGGFIFACGAGMAIAPFSHRLAEDTVWMLFIGAMVSLPLGTGLYFVGLGLQALGASPPVVVDYAKQHPYPSHEDRPTEG